jgi:hypothetical protein
MASPLIHARRDASLIRSPSGPMYVNPRPERRRRMPGSVSLTYRSPASSAASAAAISVARAPGDPFFAIGRGAFARRVPDQADRDA